MRPKSIVTFEWLYLGSVLLSLVISPWTISQTEDMFRANPVLAQFDSFGRILIIVSLVVGVAIALVLWYFVARRASNVAKWLFVAVTSYGILSAINVYVNPVEGMGPPLLTSVPLYALQVAAMYCLFRKDAVAWLEGKAPVDPNEFR